MQRTSAACLALVALLPCGACARALCPHLCLILDACARLTLRTKPGETAFRSGTARAACPAPPPAPCPTLVVVVLLLLLLLLPLPLLLLLVVVVALLWWWWRPLPSWALADALPSSLLLLLLPLLPLPLLPLPLLSLPLPLSCSTCWRAPCSAPHLPPTPFSCRMLWGGSQADKGGSTHVSAASAAAAPPPSAAACCTRLPPAAPACAGASATWTLTSSWRMLRASALPA